MAMPDSRRYFWDFDLIKNVEDTVIFLRQKVFMSESFYIASYKQEMLESLSQGNRK